MGPAKTMNTAPAAPEAMMAESGAMIDETLPPEEQIAQLEGVIDWNLGELGLKPLATLGYDPEPFSGGTAVPLSEKGQGRPRPEAPPGKEESTQKNNDQSSPNEEDKNKSPKPDEEHCAKVCTVIDSICDAAERICQIAERMPPGSDAPQRCERAQNACRQARSHGEGCGCSM